MEIVTQRFRRRRVLQYIHRRPFPLGDSGPVVSFTFDDFPRTAYSAGGAILRDHGARGTFYTAMGLMDSSNGSGDQFRLDDLYALVADGHELASHTFHHVSSHGTPVRAFLKDVHEGRAAMQAIPGLTVSKNFAYPYGAVSASAKRAVGKDMLSCRGAFPGVNGPSADLNLLRANTLYGHTDQLSLLHRLLDDSERLKGWVIFYTHDVRKRPSPFGCTPDLLESAVNLARQRSMKILTVDEVLAAVRDQP